MSCKTYLRVVFILKCDTHTAEKLGTSFLIVKSDIQGNIDRLSARLQTNPARYSQLYSVVLDEVKTGDTGSTSCTKGLLWLQRYI